MEAKSTLKCKKYEKYEIPTFNLPNFQDRVIQGSGIRGNVGTYKAESLPNITGTLDQWVVGSGTLNNTGVFGTTSSKVTGNYGGSTVSAQAQVPIFNANASSSTYQTNAPVQPNAILIQCCIKY